MHGCIDLITMLGMRNAQASDIGLSRYVLNVSLEYSISTYCTNYKHEHTTFRPEVS